jgi:hypothetical protein
MDHLRSLDGGLKDEKTVLSMHFISAGADVNKLVIYSIHSQIFIVFTFCINFHHSSYSK